MEKILNIFLYLISLAIILASTIMLYAAYRDRDFELSLFALLGIVAAKIVFDTAKKRNIRN